ncbi:MAG: GDSL family lipase, partial [Planctomycetes bacterium]|nr:GDSL family lipase [Planctomycetota bacterium]
TDAKLLYSGRWDRSQPAGPRAEWPACTVRLRFEGTALNVALGGAKDHAFQVVVDGKPTAVVTIVPGQSLYEVAAGLPAGEHLVELCKRTECWAGPVQVKGFQLSAGAKLLDPPVFRRRVEFIGDSITCGYGNEAASKEEHFSFKTENAWLAWGAVAARALDAEYSCQAISGIWLQETAKKKAMPAHWGATMPFTPSPAWDHTAWQADAVVVNLGTNDSSTKVLIEQQKWRDAYVPFIAAIRKAYPQAHIFLTIGSMGHGVENAIPKYNAAIVEELKAAGDAKVHSLAIPNQKMEDGIGADWHPSARTHQKMADVITAAIKAELGW